MATITNERYLNAKRQYEIRLGSITEQNTKLKIELMQYAMRKSLKQ
jgi:hypothetical protein